MSASKGQVVEVQITTGRWSLAVVAKIISGDTVNLVAFTDGDNPWPDVSTPNGLVAGSITSVTKGASVGQWRELSISSALSDAIAAAVATAISDYALEADLTSALVTVASNLTSAVAIIDSNMASTQNLLEDSIAALTAVVDGKAATPGAGTSHAGLGFGAARQPSSTRPTWVVACGTYTIVSALLGTQTAAVDLLSDSGSNPTTMRCSAPGSGAGVAATIKMPWSVSYFVPAGHYYKLVESHSANVTVAILEINESAC